MPERPTIDQTLMNIAVVMAARGTCSRGKAGAVLARDGRVIASGYNGAPAGMTHCDHSCDCDVERRMRSFVEGTHLDSCATARPCLVAVHAETNAVAFAARNGLATEGTTLYTTIAPCLACAQLLVNAGIIRVIAMRPYRDEAGVRLLEEAHVSMGVDRTSR